jgi:hypothetical protein
VIATLVEYGTRYELAMKASLLILVGFFAFHMLSKQSSASTEGTPAVNIGEIEFFGYESSKVDIRALAQGLPFHEGEIVPGTEFHSIRHKINEAAQRVTGHAVTDVSAVCCDPHGHFLIYIGLGASNARPLSYYAAPRGGTRLPDAAMKLNRQASDALERAVMKGVAGEDDSQGYALLDDKDARKQQLALRAWALRHESLIFAVLEKSSNAEHRRAAAQFLGYAKRSQHQLAALAHAASDPGSGVRNNAVRALLVLANSSPAIAEKIPAAIFVGMLNSGSWTDRNKAGGLLLRLTEKRDPKLLEQLRTEALNSLVEMARWRDLGHAFSYRIMLGRIAGMDETHVEKMAEKSDQVELLIVAARKTMSPR